MKKSDLKRLIKPIVKECINEVLLEQGLLSNIISEVVKGIQPPVIPPAPSSTQQVNFQQRQLEEQRHELEYHKQQQLKEQKRKLLDAAGFDSDIFAGTRPIVDGITTENKAPGASQGGALAGVDPHDAGVDIDGIMSLGGRDWGKMI